MWLAYEETAAPRIVSASRCRSSRFATSIVCCSWALIRRCGCSVASTRRMWCVGTTSRVGGVLHALRAAGGGDRRAVVVEPAGVGAVHAPFRDGAGGGVCQFRGGADCAAVDGRRWRPAESSRRAGAGGPADGPWLASPRAGLVRPRLGDGARLGQPRRGDAVACTPRSRCSWWCSSSRGCGAWWRRSVLLAYPVTMGVALVYLGEHYVVDVSPVGCWSAARSWCGGGSNGVAESVGRTSAARRSSDVDDNAHVDAGALVDDLQDAVVASS